MRNNGKLNTDNFVKDIRNCGLCGKPVEPGKQATDKPYRHKTCQFQCPVCLKQVDEADAVPNVRLRHRNCIMSPEATHVIAKQVADQMAILFKNFSTVSGHEIGAIRLNPNRSITLGIKQGQQNIIISKRIIL